MPNIFIKQHAVPPWKKYSKKSRYKASSYKMDKIKDPNLKRPYRPELTEKQKAVLNGEIPLDEVRINDLTMIKLKAEY